MKQGSSLEEAMDAYGSPMLAEKLGGSIDVVSKKKTVPVPYLPITPQMRTGVKSVPYSLFTAAGAALGLQAIKNGPKIAEKISEAGLSMIELVEGFWCDPFEVRVVKSINDKSCLLYMSGMGAMDGFVIDYPAEEVVQAVIDAREGTEEEEVEEEDE